MIMKKLCAALCALTLLATAACGEAPAPPPEPTPQTSEDADKAGRVEIVLPGIGDAVMALLYRPAVDGEHAVRRSDFSSEEFRALKELLLGVELIGPAEGPEYDAVTGKYISGPRELYEISLTCRGDIPDAFGYSIVLHRCTVYEGNIIFLPGSGYFEYDPESFDIGVLDRLTADLPMPKRSAEDIAAAEAALREWMAEAWSGIVLEDVWYDAGLDAYWSDVAAHDNFGFNEHGTRDCDFLGLCFTYSSPYGEKMAELEPGETGVVVMLRGEDGWEYRVWTAHA